MRRRTVLIILVVVEAILAVAAYDATTSPQVSIAINGAQSSLLALGYLLALALGVVVGALCRAWQGAIALAMLAALPTAIQVILRTHANPLGYLDILAVMAPLVTMGLLGWLLRYASAEISA